MNIVVDPIHPWLRTIRAAYVPGQSTSMLDRCADDLLSEMQSMGHSIQNSPDDGTDVILTTALYGKPQAWRDAPMFTARRKYRLKRSPVVITLMQIGMAEFQHMLGRLDAALTMDMADTNFDGLAPDAWKVLVDQGRRGGAMLVLQRILQAQAKSIRMILFVGDDEFPERAYHFDLVGAYPRSTAGKDFYRDIALRIATAACAEEIPPITASGESIPCQVWDALTTPDAMEEASRQFGLRGFFSNMVKIADLVGLPSVSDAVASQYSEGCFGTWDDQLCSLVVTAAGSSKPVNKSQVTEANLAVAKANGTGIAGLKIDGKPYQVPSSESYEMTMMDGVLPRIEMVQRREVPVVRSKLHGHRGISAYCADQVEYVPMAEPYFHFPVSCGTYSQAQGIIETFSRSHALNNPDDPRQIVFTVLPGHGVFIVEKWCRGKTPFQAIWECMDAGHLEVSNEVPQGVMSYVREGNGRMQLAPLSSEIPRQAFSGVKQDEH